MPFGGRIGGALMFLRQFYLPCLAHASYLIGANGEAAVIDPQRDVDCYIQEAQAAGLKIRYVIETHMHADFVSGHRELAERTGAQIIVSERARGIRFPHIAAADGAVFKLGTLELAVLETPGHTMDSICVLMRDTSHATSPLKLFSGDTLFCGDVGRVDLAASQGHPEEEMAGLLYDSLHHKILKLDDQTEVYPSHGAGSLCGKHIGKELNSTIGRQKRLNYALRPMAREAFIALLTEHPAEIPAYFAEDVKLNRKGAGWFSSLKRPEALNSFQARALLKRGAVLLDVRRSDEYSQAHVTEALHIPRSIGFSSWAGTLIPVSQKIILATSSHEAVEESVVSLARVGLEKIAGYLEDGWLDWHRNDFSVQPALVATVNDLYERIMRGTSLVVLDVRRLREYEIGHIPDAVSIPLDKLPQRLYELPEDKTIAVVCAAGYRSAIAQSVLERAGLTGVINVIGGTEAWDAAGYPLESQLSVGLV